jgi:hypothetical protein
MFQQGPIKSTQTIGKGLNSGSSVTSSLWEVKIKDYHHIGVAGLESTSAHMGAVRISRELVSAASMYMQVGQWVGQNPYPSLIEISATE